MEIKKKKKLTKGKVIQIGLLISLLGLICYELVPQFGLDNFTISTISNLILIVIVISWVTSYVYRVISGKMTFMEQRKRYRKKYEKIMDDVMEVKFNEMSKEEQEKLIQDLDKNP